MQREVSDNLIRFESKIGVLFKEYDTLSHIYMFIRSLVDKRTREFSFLLLAKGRSECWQCGLAGDQAN